MNLKLYQAFGFLAIGSGIVTLGRIAMGEDRKEVMDLNIVWGIICLIAMILLMYRERRKIERRA